MNPRRAITRRVLRPGRPGVDRAFGSLVAVAPAPGRFVMTYDDGPDPQATPGVLAALAEVSATATFFVLVNRARKEPGLLAEVAAAGHEIALHGIDHRPLTSFTGPQVRRRTADGRRELEDLLAKEVRWFRPPYGHQELRHWRAVRRTGLEQVLWGPGLMDWEDVSTEQRLVSALDGAGPGVVVLGHDGRAGRDDGVDDPPIPAFDRGELTRRVLAAYGERGLSATSLGEALVEAQPVREAWFRP